MSATKIGLEEIRRASGGKSDTGALLCRMVRPTGYYVAWAAIRLGLRPLQVSYFNFFLGNAICLTLAFGDSMARIIAACLLVVWQIMDTTDGNMARAMGIRSNYGGFIDAAGGMYLLAFLQLSIGAGLWRMPDGSAAWALNALGTGIEYQPVYIFVIATLSVTAAQLARILHQMVRIRFGLDMVNEKLKATASRKESLQGFAIRYFKELENVGGLQFMFIVAGALSGTLELVVVLYFLVSIVMLTGYTMKLFYALRNHHDYLR